MAIIGTDGLSLLLGDGAGTETFTALKGLQVQRFELKQRNFEATAVASDAWVSSTGVATRRVMLDGDALANDEAAALRLRSLAMSGAAGNFRLELSATQTLGGAAVVTLYREIIAAGDIKQLQFRLESSGALAIA